MVDDLESIMNDENIIKITESWNKLKEDNNIEGLKNLFFWTSDFLNSRAEIKIYLPR